MPQPNVRHQKCLLRIELLIARALAVFIFEICALVLKCLLARACMHPVGVVYILSNFYSYKAGYQARFTFILSITAPLLSLSPVSLKRLGILPFQICSPAVPEQAVA